MDQTLLFIADLIAICVMTFALYFPRHRRRDMVVAFLGANIGVAAVSIALSSSSVGAGLGLGLFGILSIIRLRSSELDQAEVAYYFASLALGLLGGIAVLPVWATVGLMVAILLALFLGDHPSLLKRHRVQVITVDTAIADETALARHLEALLGGRVHKVIVRKVDLVNDTTSVEVRYEAGASADTEVRR